MTIYYFLFGLFLLESHVEFCKRKRKPAPVPSLSNDVRYKTSKSENSEIEHGLNAATASQKIEGTVLFALDRSQFQFTVPLIFREERIWYLPSKTHMSRIIFPKILKMNEVDLFFSSIPLSS